MKGVSALKNIFKNISPWMRRGFLVVLAILVLGSSFLVPQPANACTFGDVTCYLKDFFENWIGAAIGSITAFILATVNWFLSLLVWATKEVTDWMVEFSLSVPYTSGPVIESTWPVTRDLANMGLILVLVAIGIGTILNLKQGAYRKRLGAFFLIALLINFTPVITGLVIDVSNITARVFYDSAANSPSALINFGPAKAFGADFGATYQIFETVWGGDTQNSGFQAAIAVIVKGISGIAFNIMLIFLFILLSVLFLARIMFLWLLVVLSPLAFLLYILPTTKKWFDRWWKNFFQWSIIVVPLLFFLWMAGLFANNGTQVCTSAIQDESGEGIVYDDAEGASFTEEEICSAANAFLAAAALFAGVVISLNSSAEGASIITKKTKQYSTAVGKRAARGLERGAYVYGGRAGKVVGNMRAAKATKEGARNVTQQLKKIPGVEGVGKALGAVGTVTGTKSISAAAKRKARGRYEEVGQEWKKNKEYNNWSPKARVDALGYERDPQKRAKLLDLLANDTPWELQKHFAGLSEKEKKSFKKEVEQREQFFTGSSRSVYDALPQLQDDKALKTWAGFATPQKLGSLGENELSDKRVVKEIVNSGKLGQLNNAIRYSADKQKAFGDTLEKIVMETKEQDEGKTRGSRAEYAKKTLKGGGGFTTAPSGKRILQPTPEQIQEAKRETAKDVERWVRQNSPKSTEATSPSFAAAVSASQDSGIFESTLERQGLSEKQIGDLRDTIKDSVKQSIQKEIKDDPEKMKKKQEQRRIVRDALRDELTNTSDMHELSDSGIDRLVRSFESDFFNDLRSEGVFDQN